MARIQPNLDVDMDNLIGGGQLSAPGNGGLPPILAALTQGLNQTFNPEQLPIAELAQLQTSPEDINQIIGSMPFGAAGTVGRAAKGALGSRFPRRLGGSPEQTLLPSELTRLRLLSEEQQRLHKIAFEDIKKGARSAQSRRSMIDLDDISAEVDRLTTTAQNRFLNLFGRGR